MTLLLPLLGVACQSGNFGEGTGASAQDTAADPDTNTAEDTAADTATDTATDTDTAADPDAVGYPYQRGFDLDGLWYPVTPIFPCMSTGFAVDDGDGYGRAEADFGGPIQAGSYVIALNNTYTPPEPGEVLLRFIDYYNEEWLSRGTTGTLSVIDAGNGVFDVVWEGVNLYTEHGNDANTEQGWVSCSG